MKRIANLFLGGGILAMAVGSGIFITGCNGNNKEADTNNMAGKDTMMANNDTSMRNSDMDMKKDSTAAISPKTGKDSMARPGGTKTARKGKVSIVAADAATDKKSAIEMDKEGYYKNTEVLPAFPGGQKALERFFADNIKYPDAATENEAQGTVNLIFSVDENGKIYQPLTVGDKIGYGIEDEAIRVFNKMPKWTPGKIKGKNVKTRFTLPIKFQIY